DTGRGPGLQPSCMVSVTPGMKVETESPAAKRAQEGIIEMLLINHPLDCPVCDKGGECPLQDQSFSHGPGESRFVEEKRHFAKPILISPLVALDRERCILCDRCTRFAKDVAGDPLIHFVQRGNQTQVLTFPDEPFSSYFSGNTVQICPVGALTATPYRFRARPWDLEAQESTCTTCSVGCRITVQSSRDEVLRYQGVDADPVNWGWLCDKGRFGFQSMNSERRLSGPMMRDGDELVATSWAKALDAAAAAIKTALSTVGAQGIGIIGGARGTNEDAYAWAKLAKSVIGTGNTDAQLGDGLPAEVVLGLPRATIDEAATATTVLVLGPDIKEELPVLYLRLRDGVENHRIRLIELSPISSGLARHTFASLQYRPGEEAAAVRALLGNGSAAAVGFDEAVLTAAREQLQSGSLVVVLGRGSLASSADFTVEAAGLLHQAFPEAKFLSGLRRGNVHGALDMGLAPGVLPGRTATASAKLLARWNNTAAADGLDTRAMLEAAATGKLPVLVLLGADPLGDFPDTDLAQRALAGAGTVIAVDTHPNASVLRAHVVLAASGFGEKAGTTTNLEGRVSHLSQKVTSPGTARADWIIASELAYRLGSDLGLESVEQIWNEIRAVSPPHAAIDAVELASRRDGVVATGSDISFVAPAAQPLPAADAYALRLAVSRKLYDAGVTTAFSESLAGLAPGSSVLLNPYDFDRIQPGAAGVRVTSTRTSVVLPAVRSDRVPRGSAWVAHYQPDVQIGSLVDLAQPVIDVRVETL
ncbi:MAG: nuoG, partial [Acidimicrobiia bacterium]|nr:nuoG [Acidimicrobiia bacterium]